MRFFNVAGPVCLDEHYAVPPLDRVDVDEILALIRTKQYFVLHAPRQTGKTSALIALRDLLNCGEAGDFRCVDVNVESARWLATTWAVASAPCSAAWRTARCCWATTTRPGPGRTC